MGFGGSPAEGAPTHPTNRVKAPKPLAEHHMPRFDEHDFWIPSEALNIFTGLGVLQARPCPKIGGAVASVGICE